MMNNKATEEELAEIHNGLATWCLTVLRGVPLLSKEGTAVLDESGKPYMVPPKAEYLSIIRQFLKDNRIEASIEQSKPLHDLSDLPTFTDDDTVIPLHNRKRG